MDGAEQGGEGLRVSSVRSRCYGSCLFSSLPPRSASFLRFSQLTCRIPLDPLSGSTFFFFAQPPAAVAASAGAQAQAEAAAAPGDGAVFDALVNQFLNPKGSNLTATVEEFLDMCDYAFLMHLNMLIGEAGPKSERGMRLTEVGKEINLAMQRRLVVADANLRDILSAAPDIKAMEGKLKRCLRTGQVDMAFMVMLNMNLAQAREADGAENAVMVLTHLNTVIMEALDERVAPEVRLLRLLLRTTCKGVREQMLKDNLILPARAGAGGGADGNGEGAVESGSGSPGAWRRVEVTPDALRGAIGELVQQARQIGKVSDICKKQERNVCQQIKCPLDFAWISLIVIRLLFHARLGYPGTPP
ncbi:unnamed protein product [Phaeothamnion confervicola]